YVSNANDDEQITVLSKSQSHKEKSQKVVFSYPSNTNPLSDDLPELTVNDMVELLPPSAYNINGITPLPETVVKIVASVLEHLVECVMLTDQYEKNGEISTEVPPEPFKRVYTQRSFSSLPDLEIQMNQHQYLFQTMDAFPRLDEGGHTLNDSASSLELIDTPTVKSRRWLRTSTSKPLLYKRKCIKSRQSSHPSSVWKSMNTNGPCLFDENHISILYKNAINELHGWLLYTLKNGDLLPMTDVKIKYQDMLKRRHEAYDEVVQTIRLRQKLENNFKNEFHFVKLSNKKGTYICLNDISTYARLALSSANDESQINDQSTTENTRSTYETLFAAIKFLRKKINDGFHVFETVNKNKNTLAEFTINLYNDYVPLLLRNFLGFLTINDKKFDKMQYDFDLFKILDEDLFRKSHKWLKIASVGYDIMNCKNDNYVSPKHYLLGNEVFKHERSLDLLTILNRFGHTCSYRSIVKLHQQIAEKESFSSSIPKSMIPNSFGVKVADNFDLNKQTLRGENSLHILNQIIIQNPENEEQINTTPVVACDSDKDLAECVMRANPHEES
ncbi:unnamed protein product, partial [Didymodactylos carnosus]